LGSRSGSLKIFHQDSGRQAVAAGLRRLACFRFPLSLLYLSTAYRAVCAFRARRTRRSIQPVRDQPHEATAKSALSDKDCFSKDNPAFFCEAES